MKSSLWLIPVALICVILLFSQEIQTAYAQAVITVITPTGGGFVPTTADCTDITAGNDVAWINCNDTSKLYAIGDSSGIVLANITTSAAGNQLLACLADISCVFLNDPTANRVSKYQLAGSTIALQGFWNSACNTDSRFIYDTAGFIWLTCSATDQIVRLNPNTLATDTLASTGATCVSPDFVSYSPLDNIGTVHCLNGAGADTIITFSRTSSIAISVLDTETTTSATQGIFIDGAHNLIMAPTGTTMIVWTYTSGGLLTLSQTLTGEIIDQCHIEPYAISASTSLLYTFCVAYSAPDTIMSAFLMNSTGVFKIFSGATVFNDANAIGLDVHDGASSLPVWYISSSTNNGKYIRVEGIRSLTSTNPDTPEPPDDDDDDNIVGGVDCNLPQNQETVACRTDENGAIAGGGSFLIGDTDGGTGLIPIFCSLGIVDCAENPDMKTNGAGLIFTLIALAVAIGIFWVATRGDLASVPIFIWMLVVLAIFGFATLAELIDVTFLMIAVVAIIALATAKLRGLFGGEFK